jgi:uncharacterized membrane protein (UPF0127 family)
MEKMMLFVNDRPVPLGVTAAAGLCQRFLGLMGQTTVTAGLLLPRCSAIHTFFMRCAIDAVFLDGSGRALKVVERLAPWRTAVRPGAAAVLELPGGTASGLGITAGAALSFRPPLQTNP